jgi:hypothetical protein
MTTTLWFLDVVVVGVTVAKLRTTDGCLAAARAVRTLDSATCLNTECILKAGPATFMRLRNLEEILERDRLPSDSEGNMLGLEASDPMSDLFCR